MAFVPCPSCKRHVRSGDEACPFCASSMPGDARAIPALANGRRLGRSALFAFAVGVAGCSSSSDGGGTTTDSGTADTGSKADAADEDTGGGMALYGAPADTGTPDTGSKTDAGDDVNDTGGAAPAYGLPADSG
ncbi:MAG: hypothetical protein ACXWUG_06460 [Polyangiales bacterium]